MKPVVLSTIGSDGEGTAMSWCSDEIVLGIHYLLDDKLRLIIKEVGMICDSERIILNMFFLFWFQIKRKHSIFEGIVSKDFMVRINMIDTSFIHVITRISHCVWMPVFERRFTHSKIKD